MVHITSQLSSALNFFWIKEERKHQRGSMMFSYFEQLPHKEQPSPEQQIPFSAGSLWSAVDFETKNPRL